MQHTYGLQEVHIKDAWLTIGSFDGVHLGHQEIIRNLTAGAHAMGAPAVVLTFYPHPSQVVHGPRESFYLTFPEQKAALLGNLGVDLVITYPFDRQVAGIGPQTFVQTLKNHLGFKQLWVGYDFALGRNRAGDVPTLTKLGEEMDFQVHQISAQRNGGGNVISSSRIRELLRAGDVDEANHMLGWQYTLTGPVISGDGRGRTIGIPTANVSINKFQVVPGAGVYACWAEHQGKRYGAVTNIGFRPTFENEPVAARIEAHILDFSGDIYDDEVTLTFISRLRGEKRFDGPEALVAQIHADIDAARVLFAK